MIDSKMRQALLEEAGHRDEHAEELETNEEGVYTEDDIKFQRDRANYLQSLAEDKGELHQCSTCGHIALLPRYAQSIEELGVSCPVCDTSNSFLRIPFTSGYDRPHMLQIWARADMLETIGGYDEEGLEREYSFALSATDYDDPDTLRWLAALVERRLRSLAVARN